jgi:hypothetical protein
MNVLYYASMLRCWHLVWILDRTNRPCLEVGCHNKAILFLMDQPHNNYLQPVCQKNCDQLDGRVQQ